MLTYANALVPLHSTICPHESHGAWFSSAQLPTKGQGLADLSTSKTMQKDAIALGLEDVE